MKTLRLYSERSAKNWPHVFLTDENGDSWANMADVVQQVPYVCDLCGLEHHLGYFRLKDGITVCSKHVIVM